MLSQSRAILLLLRASILDARYLTRTQGRIRNRVLFANRWRFFSFVGLSQPMKESRDLTDHVYPVRPL